MRTYLFILFFAFPLVSHCQKYCVDTLVFDRMVNEVLKYRKCDSLLKSEQQYSAHLEATLVAADSIIRVQNEIIKVNNEKIRNLSQALNSIRVPECKKVNNALLISIGLNVLLIIALL